MLSAIRANRSSALLAALALLLALHPLSGAAFGKGEGLAELIRSLVCGCESCATETEAAVSESSSCCSEDSRAPATPEAPGEPSGTDCLCGHPANVPMPAPTPLCEVQDVGAGGSLQNLLARQTALSATTPDPLAGRSTAGSRAAPPGSRPRFEPRDGVGEPPGLPESTTARLAVLCVALV